MQSCACRPRQTLADRINAIIAKYETNCECPDRTRTFQPSVPKIISSPCLRGSPCSPCTPCPPCPPSPGPGLCQYVSRRNLCPALKGCLSLYKRPSGPYYAAPQPRCSSVIGCPRSRPSCAVVKSNSRPPSTAISQGAPSAPGHSWAQCKPCVKCPRCSSCPRSETPCQTRQRVSQQCYSPPCVPCPTVRSRSTTPCCYLCTPSTEWSSSSAPGTCCSRTERKRLTVFDDPPYTTRNLEREFSNRFIRLDPCYCETDSSSSLDN